MNEILHANIFFIIASIATVCFGVLICIALYHLIKIMKSIRKIAERVEAGSEVLVEDIEAMRSFIMDGGIFSRIFGMFFGGGQAEPTRRKSRPTTINKTITKNYGPEKNRSL